MSKEKHDKKVKINKLSETEGIKKSKKDKKHKRSETDGVKKIKKEKKLKLTEDNITAVIAEVEKAAPPPTVLKDEKILPIEKDLFIPRPIGSLVPFANPLADERITKKVLKSVKKASKVKTLKRGVKEVVKALRKSPQGVGNTSAPGVVVLAADISPMDVISHIPVLCEEHNVPYIFVKSRAELGSAGNTKRPTSVVMVSETRANGSKKIEVIEGSEEFKETYKKLVAVVEKEAKLVRI
ncbi:H/ACA ribonucleoprotein complex subunit NHP2 [Erysiphe necator]|uniref:H/ACA ribonucleoprotein complex subunit 2 n=1 Tax=Uncinula necator TaxID=52586 RepID=A0A0B1PEC7_UNCNE|nr:H/ACA ribonucleoprotein complex subunit NHP2 [Erysiphe necator]KHJ35251.1 putative ribosome biogenesis protein nhp2 [Erysiphe necator]